MDGYSFEDLIRGYRLALYLVLLTLSTVDQMDLGDGRGVALMRGWIARLHARLAEMDEAG